MSGLAGFMLGSGNFVLGLAGFMLGSGFRNVRVRLWEIPEGTGSFRKVIPRAPNP